MAFNYLQLRMPSRKKVSYAHSENPRRGFQENRSEFPLSGLIDGDLDGFHDDELGELRSWMSGSDRLFVQECTWDIPRRNALSEKLFFRFLQVNWVCLKLSGEQGPNRRHRTSHIHHFQTEPYRIASHEISTVIVEIVRKTVSQFG